ncbi:unnamed protein product, partial [Cyprideis torosa]
MQRYREVSAQIMSIFSGYTDLIEQLSVDEAFLDVTQVTALGPTATDLAQTIRHEIVNTTGLTASAGVSYNKFLAKIASDIHKPNGLTVIRPEEALSFLDRLPIGKFYGVGKVTEKKMIQLGIRTGKELRQFTKDDLNRYFGKSGIFFYNIVRGIDNRPIKPN